MANFKNALELTLQDMHTKDDNDLCYAIYYDASCEDNAIVMFMEYPAYGNMHAVMKDLHKLLSDKLGYPVSICHNGPTEEEVLIQGEASSACVYYSDECCKNKTIEICKLIITGVAGYRNEYRALAFGANAYAQMCEISVSEVLHSLDWNKDPQSQVLQLLTTAYNDTQL